MSTNSGNLKRLNHLISEIDAAYHESSLRLGISNSVSRILYTICNVGDSCLLSVILKQTGLSKQTVNSALPKLEKDGLIYLAAVDGKSKNVCLTESGKLFAENTAIRLIHMENSILDSWSSSDVNMYLDLTQKFLDGLREKVSKL